MKFIKRMKKLKAMKGGAEAGMARHGLMGAACFDRADAVGPKNEPNLLKLSELKSAGHLPTLLTAFLYFDFAFMVWTVLGPLSTHIGEALNLDAGQKGMMVAIPILSGAFLRIVLGLLVDRAGAKNTGVGAQVIVIGALAYAWLGGLPTYGHALFFG